MSGLSGYSDRGRVIKALERAGFQRAQGAKHLVMHHANGRHTTIPNSRVLKIGTLKAIIRQCGLTHQQFIELYSQ